jgi:hypothetical protein
MDFYEIEMGPTDLLSAVNREEIFANPVMRELARLFHVTTLNASFIHPKEEDYIAFAHTVHEFTPDNMVGLAIPLEMRHVFNDKYIDRVRENIRIFREHLPNHLKEVVLVVIFDEHYLNNAGSKYTYEDLFDRANSLDVHEHTMVDFVFHHGRANIESEFVAEAFKTSVQNLNQQYLKDIARRGENLRYRHTPAQLMPESHNNELTYHKGELYIRPVLNERVTVFHERMKFTGEWSVGNFRAHSLERLNQNLQYAFEHKDCLACPYQIECASNYVHDLMAVVKAKDCLLVKRELHKLHAGLSQ